MYIDPSGHSFLSSIGNFFKNIADAISSFFDSIVGFLERITGSDWSVDVSVSKTVSFGPGGDTAVESSSGKPSPSKTAEEAQDIYTSKDLTLLDASSLLTIDITTEEGQQALRAEVRRLMGDGLSYEPALILAAVEVEVGSRPAIGDARHKFIRWMPEGSDDFVYWEMGQDEEGNIAINPPETRTKTMRYVNQIPDEVMWSTTEVEEDSFEALRNIYEQTWVGYPYKDTYFRNEGLTLNEALNSNYAVDYVIYGSGGEIREDMGWCPGSY